MLPANSPDCISIKLVIHVMIPFADVFSVCATHALSTESEEVMGLLLGDIMVQLHHCLAVRVLAKRCDKGY